MIKSINSKIENLTYQYFPYTNVMGLSRSIIAFGTLLTLLLNPVQILFYQTIDGRIVNPLLNPIIPINKFNFFILMGFENIFIMRILAILILLGVVSGYFIKITSILHWWISISFLFFSSIIDGGDQIAAVISFLLIPLCLSDPRKNHWNFCHPLRSPKNLIGLFSIWMIRIQVAVIYYHASVGKLSVKEWSDGTATYYWLNHSVFGMPIFISNFMNYLLSYDFFIILFTYGSIFIEILIFLGLTASIKYRKRILIFAIIFHFLIIVFHGIFSFFFSITGALILFLYPTYQHLNYKLWFQKK